MTSLPKNLAVALTTLLFACGGAQSSDPSSSSPSESSPASGSPEAADEELPGASFCGGATTKDVNKAIFEALAPAPNADYLAMRRNAGSVPSPGLTKDLETIAERGELCAGATDVAKCKADYAALSPPISLSDHHCFTRGDSVGCLETKAEAMAFLGKVHSIEEAFFVAAYDGYYAQCTYSQVVARGKQLADGTFRLDLMKGGGCADIFRAKITVLADGTVTEISSEKTDLDLGCP